MNPQKVAETEQLISQLCIKFTNILKQTKEIRQTRNNLEQENQNLENMIQEEKLKFEDAQNSLDQAAQQIQQQQQELEESQKVEEVDGQSKQEQIKQELENKKAILDVAQLKLKELNQQLDQELSTQSSLQIQRQNIEENLRQIKAKVQEHQEIASNIEQNTEDINLKNEELAEKIKNLILIIEQNDSELRKTMEEKCIREDEYKMSLQEYRQILAQTSKYQKQTKEGEKIVQKLSEELKSKLKRLDILVKNKSKLEQKLQKHEQLKFKYEEIAQSNAILEEENNKIRSKLELYCDNETGTLQQNQSQNNSQINKSFTSFRSLKKQPQAAPESELYRKVKFNVLQTQYLESQVREMQEKDNEIFKNKKTISEINQQIEQLKVKLIEKKSDKQKLFEKLEIMKNKTEQLGNQYEQLCQEYGIQPYQDTENSNINNESQQYYEQQQQIQQQLEQMQQQHQQSSINGKKLQFSQQQTPSRSSGLKTLD
ncbi:hypothetical protein PPERSA_11524 [Pseudocohnilembus persalinus]|uniref:Uncharacterized protein n=1 Tax=Pseudocohnilembus persalinus TaxID=266149 RepID=A0A0V0QX35_PSEPJ|nr:hypothetical protein PPERSA_11524 [Pseudocohnilembus persalinus]|eukprot:KRX06879.1 hypothetical protein PPERSA_11524 [Pseudocohnilembus persalinus]